MVVQAPNASARALKLHLEETPTLTFAAYLDYISCNNILNITIDQSHFSCDKPLIPALERQDALYLS